MSRAQGQFTIIDYNDALTLTGYIGSNHPKTQMYNPDNNSYTPNWASTNLVLTPSLYIIGTTTDQITSENVQDVKWYQGTSTTAITTGGNYALSGAKNHVLTVKANVMASLPGVDFKCVITYRDPSTVLDIIHPIPISFSRVVNGSGIVDLIVMTPSGNVFKNSEVATLTAKAELWRGSTVDTTNVTYKWAIMDASVTSSSSTGYDADFGTGWRKLSNTTNMYAGATTATLTIYAAAVESYAVYRCCAKDTDSASPTYNSKFYDVCTIIDNSDPSAGHRDLHRRRRVQERRRNDRPDRRLLPGRFGGGRFRYRNLYVDEVRQGRQHRHLMGQQRKQDGQNPVRVHFGR